MTVGGATKFAHSSARVGIGAIKYSSGSCELVVWRDRGERGERGERESERAERLDPLRAGSAPAAYWPREQARALCLPRRFARGACVAPPRARMKGRNITSICNSLRQIDINGDGFNKV